MTRWILIATNNAASSSLDAALKDWIILCRQAGFHPFKLLQVFSTSFAPIHFHPYHPLEFTIHDITVYHRKSLLHDVPTSPLECIWSKWSISSRKTDEQEKNCSARTGTNFTFALLMLLSANHPDYPQFMPPWVPSTCCLCQTLLHKIHLHHQLPHKPLPPKGRYGCPCSPQKTQEYQSLLFSLHMGFQRPFYSIISVSLTALSKIANNGKTTPILRKIFFLYWQK